MRRALFVVVILAQIALLAYLAGQREWILAKGEVVYLRTAPIDPRDPLRGDYVVLSYDLNQVPLSAFRQSPDLLKRGQIVYAALSQEAGDLYRLDYLSLTPPGRGQFLKGRVAHFYDGGGRREQGFVDLRYGIEKMFVEQGSGKAIEQRRGVRDGVQVPMEVAVAIGRGGVGQIKTFRWSPVGLQFQRVNSAAASAEEGAANLRFQMNIHNFSDAPLRIIDGPEHCAFRLDMLPGREATAAPREIACSLAQWQQEKVISLAPGEVHSTQFDLSLPRWYVYSLSDREVWGNIAELALGQRFRLTYLPASAAGVRSDAALLWQHSLSTPAFNARGFID
ncbi:GDYXXLXY domain-containing protein [Spongiibacter taiwanensis]|uniref:GDYXXLXY domain-containing protein n=1 Tax=Spongiibacter taiwanensis TaxID=1748242 RepID=UPI00203517B1|nr:GDYXXLXY domain-containing protein [Spongiibacter taiwanensis]USA44150.1 GDYXXLXY domain-containing protein [Spongiibacter taiwanensis]